MKRIILLFVFASSSFVSAQQPPKHVVKTDVSANAPRYQIVINPESRRDIFLLDTFTGRIWRMTMPVESVYVWKAEDRVDDGAQELAWYRTHLTKEQLQKILEDAK